MDSLKTNVLTVSSGQRDTVGDAEGVKQACKVLLIALSLSEREVRGGGWRDNLKEAGGDRKRHESEGDRGGRAHCTALITAV